MVILFRPEHVGLILDKRKTETRRLWKVCRVRVGRIYQARTELFGKPFAYIRVDGIWQEQLGRISKESVMAEGYDSLEAFKEIWVKINGNWDPDDIVWVVKFSVVS